MRLFTGGSEAALMSNLPEKWTKDGSKVDRMHCAGNNLEKACELFVDAVKHRPRIRLTIRQRVSRAAAAAGMNIRHARKCCATAGPAGHAVRQSACSGPQ
jgi:hypothetical protein